MSLMHLLKRVAIFSLSLSAPAWASEPNSKCPITRADARATVAQTVERRAQAKDVRSESRFWTWWRGVMGKNLADPIAAEPHFIHFPNPAYDPSSLDGVDPAGK